MDDKNLTKKTNGVNDPGKSEQDTENQPSGSAQNTREGNKVLLVEDDKFLRDLMSSKLKKEGFGVVEATNGKDGLDKARAETFQIIVLDLILPGMDGFSFLEEIKKDEKTKSVPVVVLSNLGQKDDMEKAKKFGAKDYLIKAQLTPIEVVEKIKNILKESYM